MTRIKLLSKLFSIINRKLYSKNKVYLLLLENRTNLILNIFLILILFVLQHPVIQECWEDTTLWTFHRTGIHRQTFTVGGLQIWLAHLCSCDIMWSFKNIHIQWRISENEYRQIRQSRWRQPGELKILNQIHVLKNLC